MAMIANNLGCIVQATQPKFAPGSYVEHYLEFATSGHRLCEKKTMEIGNDLKSSLSKGRSQSISYGKPHHFIRRQRIIFDLDN